MLSVQIGSFATGVDAELVRRLLESAGIDSRLEGDMLAGAALPLGGEVGVKLFVASANAEEAKALLSSHERQLAAERRRKDTVDEKVARAYRLAVVGWMLFPVLAQLISLYQLTGFPFAELSERGRRRFQIALFMDLLVVIAAVSWVTR